MTTDTKASDVEAREEFEVWLLFNYATSSNKDESGHYIADFANDMWAAWKAARASQQPSAQWMEALESDLAMLRMAVAAGDPKAELLLRIEDIAKLLPHSPDTARTE